MNNTKNTREAILEILVRVDKNNSYLNILLQHYFRNYYFKNEDKALLQEITYGVIRFKQKIDWIIKQFLTLKNKKLPIEIHNILRIGVYQVYYLDKIPDYAIVNESVQLVKKIKKYEYANLVNAILRNVIRKKDQLKWPPDVKSNIEYISIFYSFPVWLIKRWINRYGENLCIQICDIMNKKPKITIRSNPIKVDLDLLKRELKKLGITFQESQFLSRELLILENIINIADSDIFKKGFFSVQDESSALASRFLAPLPGETIIDMCSGPGGKTTHMAQLMENKGRIIAFEKNKKRLNMVKDECERLGITIVETVLMDATKFCNDYQGIADRVLVDAPCSGSGVIRKKPDLKWKNWDGSHLKYLNQLQKKILTTAASYLKIDGVILYSTCSMEKEENDDIIAHFLNENENYAILNSDSFLKKYGVLKYNTDISQSIQLLPGYSGQNIDGFYMAKMQKINVE